MLARAVLPSRGSTCRGWAYITSAGGHPLDRRSRRRFTMNRLPDTESMTSDPYGDLCAAIDEACAANITLQCRLAALMLPVADTIVPTLALTEHQVLPFVGDAAPENTDVSSELFGGSLWTQHSFSHFQTDAENRSAHF